MMAFTSYYASYMENLQETEDERVANWYLMDSPSTVFSISFAYIVICKYLGPRLMKDRKPFSLKRTILIYNMIQILLCAWFSFTIIKDNTWVITKLICDPEEFNPYKIIDVCYWALYLKMLELVETVFFILRKKQSQVTNLHLYHHATTFLFVWLGVKYKGGLGVSTCILLNSLVHIIMYTYYSIAASGNPKTRKFLQKYKKYITIIQMVQFTIMLAIIARYYIAGCIRSWAIALLFVPNVIFVFYMFYQFYHSMETVKRKDSGK
uniref:Elongation of very long chain fatty acids protein n=1 Tax=Lygus hesperus TaxID=30085 RepID=A0A0A9YUJ5_LYGHE